MQSSNKLKNPINRNLFAQFQLDAIAIFQIENL